MNDMLAWAAVATGGALGAAMRYGAGLWAARAFGQAFPWGTLMINVGGSLAMGVAAALLLERGGPSRATLFLMTGVLGGFTTFSAFSLETIRLFEAGAAPQAAAYAVGSTVLAVAALWTGLTLGRAL